MITIFNDNDIRYNNLKNILENAIKKKKEGYNRNEMRIK